MKNFKALLWIVVFSMISSGIIAMEFKPKVYIKNKDRIAVIVARVFYD